MAIVYFGLGSNLGDRKKNILGALARMRQSAIRIQKVSHVIETKPVGGPKGQNDYLNAAAKGTTELTPGKLLRTLKSIEKKLGRKKGLRYGPRLIDIDILIYENKWIKTPKLTIPHPRMLKREFVLKPLKEIAPKLVKELLS
ncbi:MAG: 2-amino-4-hydroxy-6-hydroxymethyldihydropteridine diphosphokinase [Candidatus Omnitrophota bacterium]